MKFADRYGFDKARAETGSWVDLGDGIRVKIRRIQSKYVRDYNSKLNKPYSNLTNNGRKPLPTDIQETVSKRLGAEAILVDWEIVDDETGTSIPFTQERAIQMFDQYPDFLEDVVDASTKLENFRDDAVQEIEGNS